MKYLLDTSVIAELLSSQPNPSVVRFVDSLEAEDTFLSVISVGELAKGIEQIEDLHRKQSMKDWLYGNLLPRFEGNILPLDTEIFIRWGKLSAKLESLGVAFIAMDSLIAATALTHQMVLVTVNEDDFNNTGIEIVNPW